MFPAFQQSRLSANANPRRSGQLARASGGAKVDIGIALPRTGCLLHPAETNSSDAILPVSRTFLYHMNLEGMLGKRLKARYLFELCGLCLIPRRFCFLV
jgi:hypothetical protein